MYAGATRWGLGAGDLTNVLQPGQDPATAGNPLFNLALQYGLVPDTDAGWQTYATAWGAGFGLGAIATAPELAALLQVQAVASTNFPIGAADVVTLASAVGGAVNGSPVTAPDAMIARYNAAVAQYAPTIVQQVANSVAAQTDPAYQQGIAVDLARQAATARGVTTLGNGVAVPTEYIAKNFVCHDGTAYALVNDPGGVRVYQWLTSAWVPPAYGPGGGSQLTTTGQRVCTLLTPGTGSWYTNRVFGAVAPGDSCDATPANFTGPWDLITPDIAAALTYQDGSPVHVVPAAQQVVPIATPQPVLYQSPTAPPPAVPTAPAAPATLPPVTLYQSPPPISATAPAPPAAVTTLYQSPSVVGPGTAATPSVQLVEQPSTGISTTDMLIGGAVLVAVAAIAVGGKTRRRDW